MDVRALRTRQLAAAVAFVAATLVLTVQLITPSPVMVTVGENGTEVAELGGYFRYRDVGVITVASCLLGASGAYLLVAGRSDPEDAPNPSNADDGNESPGPSDELLEARRREWEERAERLADNEAEIYEVVMAADGVLPQNEIVERTDLSKATVSRTLDGLETKNLLERKRRGMGNVVLLV